MGGRWSTPIKTEIKGPQASQLLGWRIAGREYCSARRARATAHFIWHATRHFKPYNSQFHVHALKWWPCRSADRLQAKEEGGYLPRCKSNTFSADGNQTQTYNFPRGGIMKSLDATYLPHPLCPRLPFVTARLVIYNIRDPGVCKTRLLTFHRMLRNVKAICISAENVLSLY